MPYFAIFFAGVPQNDHPLCTLHPLKCFSQVNNLGDSILSFKNLSQCWNFRIMLIRSWFHYLLNLLFASGFLKILIPLYFLDILQAGITQFFARYFWQIKLALYFLSKNQYRMSFTSVYSQFSCSLNLNYFYFYVN